MKFRHAVRKCKHIWKNQFVYIKYCLKEIDLRPGLPLTSQQSSYYTYSSLGYYTIFTIRLHSAHILLDDIYSSSYARGSHSRDYVKLSCLLCVFCLPRSAYTIKTITPVNIHRERSFVSQTKCLSGLFTAYGTVSSRRGSESLFTIWLSVPSRQFVLFPSRDAVR